MSYLCSSSHLWAPRSASQVDENLFIGGYLAAADPGFVRASGVTRIVKLFSDSVEYPGGYCRHPGVRYLVLPSLDRPDYDILPDAEAALPFIHEGVLRGERVLVHCHAGISRSATVVLLYLMVHQGLPLHTALARLEAARPVINPNHGFMEILHAVEARRAASAP